MMVKSMSRKTVSFGQLLEYLNEPEAKGPALLHNFRASGDDLQRLQGEFLENARFLPPRRNGNILYHEILSFSDLDRNRVSPATLEDLTRQYLLLRAPAALAYAKAHFNTACPHIHLIISANELGRSRRSRLSKAEFQRIKRDLERYQIEHYPNLIHSKVQGEREPRPRRRRVESEQARRVRKEGIAPATRKDVLRDLVLGALTRAASGEDLVNELARNHLQLTRRSRTVLLQDMAHGRHYRLSTVGLAEAFWKAVQAWEAVPARLEALASLELEQSRQLWAEFGFREDVLTILQGNQEVRKDARHRSRLEEISRISRSRRHGKSLPER